MIKIIRQFRFSNIINPANIMLLLLFLCLGCGSPGKGGKTVTVQNTAIVARGGDIETPGPADKRLDGAIKALGITVKSVTGVVEIKKAVKSTVAQIFYYFGHCGGYDSFGQHGDSVLLANDHTVSLSWASFFINKTHYAPEDIVGGGKSVYSFIFMNGCWTANASEENVRLYDLLHPKIDGGGSPVLSKACFLGWSKSIRTEIASDVALRLFTIAKEGVSVNECMARAVIDSQLEHDAWWAGPRGSGQYDTPTFFQSNGYESEMKLFEVTGDE